MTHHDPFAAPPPPAGGMAQPTHAFGGYPPLSGAIGRPRPIGVCILLTVVTFGIYSYVWTYQTQEEVKRHTGRGLGGGVGLLIYLFLSPATYFILGSEVGQLQTGRGAPVPSVVQPGSGCWCR